MQDSGAWRRATASENKMVVETRMDHCQNSIYTAICQSAHGVRRNSPGGRLAAITKGNRTFPQTEAEALHRTEALLFTEPSCVSGRRAVSSRSLRSRGPCAHP